MYVQQGRKGIHGEKGRRTEELSLFTGKAHHPGGAVPSEWGNQEFLGSSLKTVSLPPFQEWEHYPQFLFGM